MAVDFTHAAQSVLAEIVELRRQLHAHAELAFEETRTAESIAARLRSAGYEVTTGIGKTGVIAMLRGTKPGPTLMIRADMDALPLREATGAPYASETQAMHACGHDGHVAMAVGAAMLLAEERQNLAGAVAFVFQPAEEIGEGAQAMIDDGVLDLIKPDRAIAIHIANGQPKSSAVVNSGIVFGGSEMFRIEVHGRGGHGAMPHRTVDPVLVGSHIVVAAQSIVSREIPPSSMGVVTFGRIQGGSAANVISERAILEGTFRYHDLEIGEQIRDSVRRIAEMVAGSMRASATFEVLRSIPPVINDSRIAGWVGEHARKCQGIDDILSIPPASASDDMAHFLDRVPGAYILLAAPKDGVGMGHSETFDFDEAVLGTGIELILRCALDYLT